MPYDEHEVYYQDLQNKYRCTECDPSGIHYCFKQQFKGWPKLHHAPLNAQLLNTWATLCSEGAAVIHHPPRIPEFDDLILEPLYKRNPKHAAHAMMSNQPMMPQFPAPYPYYVPPPYSGRTPRKRRNRDIDSDSPGSSPVKAKKKQSNDAFSSPLSTDAASSMSPPAASLSPFQQWCENEYQPQHCWGNTFTILRDNDVGTDLFPTEKRMKATKLIRLCKSPTIKEATAERVCKAFRKFVRRNKGKVSC
jgi:hypothetical protein